MKIGIVSSGMETLALFRFLTRYDHEYLVYYDSLHAPYGDKNFSSSLQAVEKGIQWLQDQKVDAIIVPPVYELYFLQQKKKNQILPLFQTYLLQEAFPHSLVGKLGLLWEFADLQCAQELISHLACSFAPSSAQKSTKAFVFPFQFWAKECGILNPLLTRLSRKSLLTNTLLKHELRYFKDARVDTVIPLNYLYFNAEKAIAKFFNFKKIRFHRLAKLEQIFCSLISQVQKSEYAVSIFSTDQSYFLEREKRLIWLLQRGKSIEIQRIRE